MKPRLLDYLVCPTCQSELDMTVAFRRGEEVMEGSLRCRGCASTYAVRDGVPRMVPGRLPPIKQRTAAAFGYEWTNYVELHPEYEAQFLDWIHPLQAGAFRDRAVLDAGCGIGRHVHWVSRYGAREVIGIDLSDAVDTAFANVGELTNVHIVQADIYQLPFRRSPSRGDFDFIYSIGVLHHLPGPRQGFEALLRCLQPRGTMFAWVYGRENNELVHYFIDPLRRTLTSRLPPPLVKGLSWPLAVLLHALVKGVYRRRGEKPIGLPYADYLSSLAAFSFRQNYSIVFDHLVAPIAFYIDQTEFQAWFQAAGLDDIEISWRNSNSWRGRGRMPADAAAPERPRRGVRLAGSGQARARAGRGRRKRAGESGMRQGPGPALEPRPAE